MSSRTTRDRGTDDTDNTDSTDFANARCMAEAGAGFDLDSPGLSLSKAETLIFVSNPWRATWYYTRPS
jgi:hypothetical protein